MEDVPVEMIAHIMSFLPLDARRLGTINRKFGRAFRLFHLKSKIPVDVTVFCTSRELALQRNGRDIYIQPMKLQITTKDGSVTLEVTEDHIEVEQNTDEYTIEFCKSFFTLAEICGILKPTYKKFLTDFVPLIKINTLNMNVIPKRSMSTGDRLPLISLLLEALRRQDWEVKTIICGDFPIQDIWVNLVGDGSRPPPEDRPRLVMSAFQLNSVAEHRHELVKHFKFEIETLYPISFFTEMLELFVLCQKYAQYADSIIKFKGKCFRRFLNLHANYWVQRKLDHLNPPIHMGSIDEFAQARSVSEFPAQFFVKFAGKGRGLDAFLELKKDRLLTALFLGIFKCLNLLSF